MPVSDGLTWGTPSATVNVGETITVNVSYGVMPTSAGITSNLNGLATATLSGNTVTFTGVSVGTVAVPTGSGVGNTCLTTNAFTLTVASADDESYLNKRGLTHFWENIDSIKQNKLTAGTNITISANNTISASQPTVGNATLTIQKNGTSAGTFTANATSNKTINITVPTTAADVSALPASTKYGASIAVSINTTDYKVTTTLKDQDGNTLGTAQVIDLPLESVVVNGSYDNTNKKIILTLQNGNTVDIPVGDLVAGLQTEITSTNKLSSDLVDDTNHTHKFVTSAQITKLNGIATGAEVNQNAFSNVKVGSTTVAADAKTDTLELVAGSNVTITPDATNDKVTIAATNTTYNDATTTAHGLMTAADKVKLNGIATGAEVNVQSDWSVTDSSSDAFIKNKPTIPTVNNGTLTIQKNGTNVQTFTANQSGNATANITVPTKTSDITNDSGFVTSSVVDGYAKTADLATVATSGSYNDLSNKPTIPAAQVQSNWTQTTTTAADYIKNKPTLATVATSGSYNDLSNKPTIPTVNNATLTIQKNGTTVKTFTANASSNVTANITVPTTVAELSDSSTYVTQDNLTTQLANKQNVLTAGDHINITGSTIKAVDYVHSEQPVSTTAVTPVVTNNMIADGTITADKLATGATLKLTLSTSDIGEGAPLAANTLYGVYS